jgi:hypothetical protein
METHILNTSSAHPPAVGCGNVDHTPRNDKCETLSVDCSLVEFATFADFEKEIRRIISEAETRSVPVRIMGGAAIRMHCPEHKNLYDQLKRAPKHDMDFVTYSKFRPLTKQLFTDLGYEPYISLMLTGATGRHRQIFNDKEGNKAIDVFLDRLEMCHVIDFRNRLEVDSPTVPLAELLLQKLQIVQTNEKDIQDAIILLSEHSIGKGDKEEINGDYIAKVLGGEWGFYYTVSLNLAKVREFLDKYELAKSDKQAVTDGITKLQEVIEKQPKSLQWRLRAKVGPSTKWYNVVEEVQRD